MIGIINAAERYVGGKNKYSMIILASERAKATKSKTMLYQRKTSRKIRGASSLLAIENIAEGHARVKGARITTFSIPPRL